MTKQYAHLSPTFMAGAVGKLDSVFGDSMPEAAQHQLLSLDRVSAPSGKQSKRSNIQPLSVASAAGVDWPYLPCIKLGSVS
jgi:hypothetical protein